MQQLERKIYEFERNFNVIAMRTMLNGFLARKEIKAHSITIDAEEKLYENDDVRLVLIKKGAQLIEVPTIKFDENNFILYDANSYDYYNAYVNAETVDLDPEDRTETEITHYFSLERLKNPDRKKFTKKEDKIIVPEEMIDAKLEIKSIEHLKLAPHGTKKFGEIDKRTGIITIKGNTLYNDNLYDKIIKYVKKE